MSQADSLIEHLGLIAGVINEIGIDEEINGYCQVKGGVTRVLPTEPGFV